MWLRMGEWGGNVGESKSVGETWGVGGRVGGNVGESGMGVWGVKEGVWVRIAVGLWVIVGENSRESAGKNSSGVVGYSG